MAMLAIVSGVVTRACPTRRASVHYTLVSVFGRPQNLGAHAPATSPEPLSEPLAALDASLLALVGVDVAVAVRSPATAENLPFASFAGQQGTYLHVIGKDAVTDAVRRCWASLWTDRAEPVVPKGIEHPSSRQLTPPRPTLSCNTPSSNTPSSDRFAS